MNPLSPLLLTQIIVPSPTKIDPSIVAAAHLFPSPRFIQTIHYLNYGFRSQKDFVLKSDYILEYKHMPAKLQLVGKIIAGPNKRTSEAEKKIMQFNGTIMQQTLTSVQMT